jgi:hypothetical protein
MIMEKTAAFFNRYLLTQFDVDSGALTALGVIIHNFPEAGVFHGTILRGKESIGNFILKVDESCAEQQVDIDLANLTGPPATDPCCNQPTGRTFMLSPKGFAVFHVSRGAGGFSVLLNSANDQKSNLDSRTLQKQDHFAVTILRPGTYSVVNSSGKGESRAELVVSYPQPGSRKRFEQLPAQMVTVTDKGFEPRRIQVAAAQTHVYEIKTSARIHIKLEKPDDGPSDRERNKYPSWSQPAVEQKSDQQKKKQKTSTKHW